MILNVSSRTDIIAFYEKWLIKRVEAGFVDVRNPFNPKLVNEILNQTFLQKKKLLKL